jgi:hypothetical protein
VSNSTLFARPSRMQPVEITSRLVSIAGERLLSYYELNGNCNTYVRLLDYVTLQKHIMCVQNCLGTRKNVEYALF